jgi:tetratricopeptide (TPR) repeat protein
MYLLPDVFASDSLMGRFVRVSVSGDLPVSAFTFFAVCANPMSQRQPMGIEKTPDPNNDQGQTQPSSGSVPPKPPRIASFFSAFVVLFMIAIVVIPLFYAIVPQEVARWNLAAAWEKRLNGDLPSAIDSLTAALESDPLHLEIYLQRAAWYEEIGNRESALQDFNKVHDIAGNDRRMLVGRAMTYHGMGKSDEAIRDLQQLLEEGSSDTRFVDLNILAYMRALTKTDLDQALVEINESIALDLERRGQDEVLIPEAALLDTRGFIQYQRGEFQDARDDLEAAVKQYSVELRRWERRLKSGKGIVDLRLDRLQLQVEKQTLAVVVYHRGLIYEKLEQTDLAEADFDHVRTLGFEPGDDLY